MLINEKTIFELDKLVQQFFVLNRIWDRALSVINVKFAMNKFESIFHAGLAHKYPLLADYVSGIETMFNETTNYFETPIDKSDYNSPAEFFNKNLEYHVETYNMIKKAIDVAVVNGDINVSKELDKLIRIFNKYIEQAILLVDKSKSFNGNWWAFDNMCDGFYILGQEDEDSEDGDE